jgi:hypothetical protein
MARAESLKHFFKQPSDLVIGKLRNAIDNILNSRLSARIKESRYDPSVVAGERNR